MNKPMRLSMQYFAAGEEVTKIADLIDPEVMAPMISAKIPKKIRVAPFAAVDTTLQGIPGDTITVPSYGYIGDAEDVKEGEEVTIEKMNTSTKKVTVKKAMKGVSITDEAALSGYGDPVGQANNQIALSIAAKLDNDTMDALQGATLIYDGSAKQIGYEPVVDAIDLFCEEVNTEKVMFIHPKQVTQLRKDPNFISADKYPGSVIMNGEIGMIANTRIVPTKKVPLNDAIAARYVRCDESDSGAKEIVADSATPTSTQVKLSSVTGDITDAKVGEFVRQLSAITAKTCYQCPIIKLEQDSETEDELPAVTVYLKRDTNVETERKARKRMTEITADKFYAVALSNESKAVLALIKK